MRRYAKHAQDTPLAVRAARGFTLVELAFVTAIISILSTLSLIGYANLRSNNEVRSAVQRLNATLNLSRQKAITANGRYQTFFDLESGDFWIDEVDASGAVLRRQVANPGQLPKFMRFESMEIDGVAQTGRFAAIVFFPDGSSNSATLVISRFDGDPVNLATLRVFGPTGAAVATFGQRP